MRAIKGTTYSVKEIFDLNLSDSPFLIFKTLSPNKERLVDVTIQDAYSTDKFISELGDFHFRYISTTDEGCPLFYYMGDVSLLMKKLVLEININPFMVDNEVLDWFAYLKGTDNQQYYRLSEDKTSIVVPSTTIKDIEGNILAHYPEEHKELPLQIKKYLDNN